MTIDEKNKKLLKNNETLSHNLSTMGSRLDTAIKQLSAITSLTSVPLNAAVIKEAADQILLILITELTDINACSLLIYDQSADMLKLLSAKGQADILGSPSGPFNKELSFKSGEGAAGLVFSENEPRFWNKDSDEARPLIIAPHMSTPESLACLPLSLPERPIGVLNISFGQPKPFDPPRKRDLLLLGNVVANIIQTFTLKREINEKAVSLSLLVNELETEIAERKRVESELELANEKLESRVRSRTLELQKTNESLKQEIAEKKRVAEGLATSEKRYRDLFNNISDLIVTHSLDGRLLSINPIAAFSLGYQIEDVTGKILSDMLPQEYRLDFKTNYLERIKKLGFLEGITQVKAQDGTFRYIEYRSILVKNLGPVHYVTATGRDVTDRVLARRELKAMESRLVQSQKMQAVGTLASGISHDFNNILQVISGYVQLMMEKDAGDATDRRYLTGIDNSVKRALDLVRRLLTFSRKVETQMVSLDLNRQIYQAVKLMERIIPPMIEIETYLDGDLRTISADANQIEQILMNLATNARDAMPEGGKIIVETENVVVNKDERPLNGQAAPEVYVRLKFSDTGVGIDKSISDKIFEPFFTTKDVGEGTGLGLSTVYGIVKTHGGRITVEGGPGLGASFTILLPALPDSKKAVTDVQKTSEKAMGNKETILLVDDEKEVLEIASEVLESYGYQTITAGSGESALSLYSKEKNKIDLVLLDLGMPGMGGRNCLKELIEIDPSIKVIIASGYSYQGPGREALETGAVGFIPKPYRLNELLLKIRNVLDDKPAS